MDDGLRQLVRTRARDRCEYCRIPQAAIPFARFHVEHIRARQHGGDDGPDNLALACRRCNAFKGPNLTAIDALSGDIAPLFNPRLDAGTITSRLRNSSSWALPQSAAQQLPC